MWSDVVLMKARHVYVCQSCGHQEPKWLGRCPSCEAWSSLVEEVGQTKKSSPARAAPVPLSKVSLDAAVRQKTGQGELDRVLGGGLVPGALVLVGGDPGIG